MPETDLSGFNGNVTMPSTHGGVARAFSVRRSMNTKETNRYGIGDRFNRIRGGIITVSGDINVFLRKGAAGNAPGIVTPAADGAVLTLLFETGCSLSGTAVFADWTSQHAFTDPAIEATLSYSFNGAATETWAVI